MIWIGVFFISLVQGVLATKVVLLDSNDTALGNWTSIQHDGDSQTHELYGWEIKKNLPLGKLAQYFAVCSYRETKSGPQNNWLRSPVFKISDAVVLDVEAQFHISRCSNKSAYPYCKEKVTMYYQFTDDDNGNDPINGTNYHLITHLPLNNEDLGRWPRFTVKINVTSPRKRGMVIAFKDTGSCSTIRRVNVQYKYCPSTIQNLITFPRTVVKNSAVSVKGQCQPNAIFERSSQPEWHCLTSGIWSPRSGSCICNAGYSLKDGVCEASSTPRPTFRPADEGGSFKANTITIVVSVVGVIVLASV